MSGIFTTKEEEQKYNMWSKIQIYEAYLVEAKARQTLNKEVNRLNRKLAEIKYLTGHRVESDSNS